VLEILREVQELSGRPWETLPPDGKPIGALDGFDSLTAIEATVMIEEKLGCKIPVDTVFVSDDGRRALSLNEVCERVRKFAAGVGA
jgi:acyl carrier protein